MVDEGGGVKPAVPVQIGGKIVGIPVSEEIIPVLS
jgi:hypothetical protein